MDTKMCSDWLIYLGEKGGRGVIGNIDARALKRCGEEMNRIRAENEILTTQRDEARALAREWSNDGGAEIERLRAEVEALKNHLRMIEHATAPTLDDGGYHENAYTLAQAALRGEEDE